MLYFIVLCSSFPTFTIELGPKKYVQSAILNFALKWKSTFGSGPQ